LRTGQRRDAAAITLPRQPRRSARQDHRRRRPRRSAGAQRQVDQPAAVRRIAPGRAGPAPQRRGSEGGSGTPQEQRDLAKGTGRGSVEPGEPRGVQGELLTRPARRDAMKPGCREYQQYNRRDVLRIGGATFFGLTMPQLFRAQAEPSPPVKAKQVLLVWMYGGPSQIDMFDLKPNSKKDAVRPLFKPIRTKVPELQISEF